MVDTVANERVNDDQEKLDKRGDVKQKIYISNFIF
jgi:hypothetical protein